MKTKILFIGLILIFSVNIFAENNKEKKKNAVINTTLELNGKIVDETTGEVLTGVKVQILGNSFVTYTDFDGNFKINGLKSGNYKLSTSLISYVSDSEEIFLDTENPVNIEIRLKSVNQ
ncbi:MAG: carboxypeptidase-like regulatory domain-containing protein [Bacteroidales bacterium]|nr:carboxypeptidase-like regulatory domain-containing protein [Bacteroidales bacterium]